jgi:hypothetical protein
MYSYVFIFIVFIIIAVLIFTVPILFKLNFFKKKDKGVWNIIYTKKVKMLYSNDFTGNQFIEPGVCIIEQNSISNEERGWYITLDNKKSMDPIYIRTCC